MTHSRPRLRLRRLRRVREIQEQVERQRWSLAARRAKEACQRAELAAGALARGTAELRAAQGRSSLAPAEVLQAQDALCRLGSRAARERAVASRAGAEAEALRAPWIARRAEALGLQRLCERERASQMREAERADAARLDATALERAVRPPGARPGGPAPSANGRSLSGPSPAR